MKKILLSIFALSLVFSSCEFDKGFEDMNVNPAKASQIDVANKFASCVLQTSGGRYENWRASLIYQSVMIQHFSAIAGYWSGDKYYRNDGYATSLWDRYYPSAVKEIEDILNKGFNDLVDFFSLHIKLLSEPNSLLGLEFFKSNFLSLSP